MFRRMLRRRSALGRALALVAVLVAVTLASTGAASAHAHLTQASPAQGAVLDTWPSEITMHFSEGVEVDFSTFKVYPLDASGDEQVLREAARELLPEALQARGDEDIRVDVGLAPVESPTETITIQLKDEAEPGGYAVIWRVLSIDTHIVEGFYVFTYAP